MAEPPPILDQQVLPLIVQLARVGQRAAGIHMAGCVRPRQHFALALLEERGPLSQHLLGQALRLDPSNVVGLLNELETLGLIARRRDPADRRRHIVELTAAGGTELTRTNARLRLVEDELLAALRPEERATLHSLLVRVAGVGAAGEAAGACAAEASPCGGGAEPPPC
ncbi:MarR family winged helix-turn-helix transcriptional regulator [Parafrankia elaeagni]|uniref:MarR family winged helix-turn-helix transcriptional regulator n=1 Tax=Parafrankia elaeagni TaxID=222534 RepID=UPI00037F8207|nr:MarR family winged helix-turn-helix transcriptional regulator [Parafrankia elaeagni]